MYMQEKRRATLWPCHIQETWLLMEMVVLFREKSVFFERSFS